MSEKPISPLRRRMIEDMTVRNFVEKTRNDYIRHVRTLTAFLGRSRLLTMPEPTGSFATAKTIGIDDEACWSAGTAAPEVTMTSTFNRANSVAY